MYADWLLERGDVRGQLALVDRAAVWATERYKVSRLRHTIKRPPRGRWCFEGYVQGLAIRVDLLPVIEAVSPRWLVLQPTAWH